MIRCRFCYHWDKYPICDSCRRAAGQGIFCLYCGRPAASIHDCRRRNYYTFKVVGEAHEAVDLGIMRRKRVRTREFVPPFPENRTIAPQRIDLKRLREVFDVERD